MAAPPPPPRGLSLYDNLLDPNEAPTSATISSAPVLYNQNDPATKSSDPSLKKPFQPALQFQHVRRPQVKQASKPKAASSDSAPKPAAVAAPVATSAPQKSTLADWTATQEDEWRYGFTEKRQRGGRKNKRKKQQQQAETDWDEIYDPARPTNVTEYLRSDERLDEMVEWKALLYRHRRKREESDISEDEDEDSRPMPSNQFAPPSSYNFAPPPQSPPAPPPDDNTGNDAYARQQAMSTTQNTQPPPPPPAGNPPSLATNQPPPPPPPSDSATISRAPVRYAQPEEKPDEQEDEPYSPPPALGLDTEDDDADSAPRSNRPGQAGFAQRLMNKYGWAKGSGLGVDESGITNALSVKVDKRRRKADADGGGWAEPGGKGRIIGGKRKEEGSKFGVMSEVIVLQNMLENMPDLQAEIYEGLGQEIGEECGEKYGRVERLYIDQETRQVFIKFTDQVSALRAVNELEGRVFNGNTIIPKFYDTERFERGVYS